MVKMNSYLGKLVLKDVQQVVLFPFISFPYWALTDYVGLDEDWMLSFSQILCCSSATLSGFLILSADLMIILLGYWLMFVMQKHFQRYYCNNILLSDYGFTG